MLRHVHPAILGVHFRIATPGVRWRSRRYVMGFCALTLFVGGASIQTVALGRERTQYIVDGLALGAPVAPKSTTYRQYKCRPSEQFESFIWCQRRRTENGKFGEFTSVNSILHAPDGATAYVSRYIEPAYFAPGDVEREVKRLSQRFGVLPHILQSPRRSGSPFGVIAYWGDVTLVPLDARSLAQLAAGQSVMKGMLFDFLCGALASTITAGAPCERPRSMQAGSRFRQRLPAAATPQLCLHQRLEGPSEEVLRQRLLRSQETYGRDLASS